MTEKVCHWKNIWPDVDAEDMTPEMKKDEARLKGRLKEMGLSPAEMNVLLDDENLELLVGIEGFCTVQESRDKEDPEKVYSNITKVVRKFDDET